jgi:pilus assembly protein CpaB
MKWNRNITIVVVAVLAIGIGLLVYGVLMQPHKEEPVARIVITASMNIPARAHITSPMVVETTRPADQVTVTDAIGNPADAIGQVAAVDIPEGGIITASALTRPTPAPVGLQVPPGMRAVSIPIDQVKGVSGLLHPGDKVDVMSVPARGVGDPRAYTFLRDVLILALGSDYVNPQIAVASPAPGQPAAPPPATPVPGPAGTVTLAVTPAQADLLASADMNTQLRLALRPRGERANSQPVEPVEYPQPAKPAPSSTPESAHPGVVVINGDVAQP